MKKFLRAGVLLAVLTASALFVTSPSAEAQSTGLRINPRVDVTVSSGDSQSGQLLIANLNRDIPITVDLSVVDFKSTDETGTPTPLLEENAEQTPWSLKPYINIPSTVELDAGESKYIPYSIRIPESRGAGSLYSAIKYDPRPAEGEDTVVISGSPMQLIFVTVPGSATELLSLKQFGAYKIDQGETVGTFASIFFNSQPEKLAFLLDNRGNVAESPAGSILIKNAFGSVVKTIDNANPKNNLALIDQTRRFEVCIETSVKEIEQDGRNVDLESCKNPGLAPGLYTAELSVFYGINGSSTQEINATASFWYLPLWFIGIVIGVLAILAFIIVLIRRKLIGRRSAKRKVR